MPDHGLEIAIKDLLKTYSTGCRDVGEYEMSYLSARTLIVEGITSLTWI